MVKRDKLARDQLTSAMGIKRKDAQTAQLLDQLDRTHEKAMALQAHNSFLFSELQRAEIGEELRVKTINRLKTQVLELIRDPTKSEKSAVDQLETLKKQYFMSLAVGVKLQGSLAGWFCNADMHELYEILLNEKVPIESWPEWANEQIKKRSEQEN